MEKDEIVKYLKSLGTLVVKNLEGEDQFRTLSALQKAINCVQNIDPKTFDRIEDIGK